MRYYGEGLRALGVLVLAVPVVALVHSAGAFRAIVQPATDFRVTEKVPPDETADEAAAALAHEAERERADRDDEADVLEAPRAK